MIAVVDGEEVDMDVSQVGISYSIGDPLNPGTISGTKSTTFKMPATNRVRAIMGGPTMSERPISGDPILQFKKGGVVYLEQGIRPIEWTREEVRSVSVGNNAGWLSDLKNLKLRDLPLGESPRIESSVMLSTWYDEDALVYFPVIDYGYGWDTAMDVVTADIRPALRCHRLIALAFAELGYSVKIKGGLNAVWKKFFMPCTEEVRAGQRFIDTNQMRVEQNVTAGPFAGFDDEGIKLPAAPTGSVILTDPGGNAGTSDASVGASTYYNVYVYTAPADMTIEAIVDITIRSGSSFQVQYESLFLRNLTTGAMISAPYSIFLNPLETQVRTGIHLGQADVAAGDLVSVVVKRTAGPGQAFYVDACNVVFLPKNAPYQENITVDVASCAPNLSAWDVLQGINYSRCLAFDTDDRTKVVTISYDEDKYRPISEGESLAGREDHTDPPVKGDALKAKRILFSWKEDKSDHYLGLANDSAGDRGWGGIIREIDGGVLPEKKVEMPFAATAMRLYTGGAFIPVMRENEVRDVVPNEEDRHFKRTPRILLSDGTQFTEVDGWTLNGAPMSLISKAFFVLPGETDLTMSFFPETLYGTCGPGTLASHYGGYLRRLERSKSLSIDLMLYDHELKCLDFGIPVEVIDDFGPGWYYFTEVKQKRFDVDEPTRCELIQV